MNQSYWVLEYAKVLLAYLLVMYLWPCVVFRPHLRGKSRSYRFCFCVNISLLLLHTGVLLLGLLHLLHQTLVAVLFWGVFAVQLFRNFRPGFSALGDLKSVFGRTMTPRRMLLKWHRANVGNLKSAFGRWWRSTEGRRLEYGMLGLLILFAMAYFSTNALQVHSFGFSDQYVHHAWIYSLAQGKIFPAGIYPQGLHCFVYALSTVLPVRTYSVLLFLGGIHIHVLVISVYLLSRKLFHWKLSGLFALAAFLTVGQPDNYGVTAISRLAGTLPQEFALYTVFLTAYGLIGFLQKTPEAFSGRFRLVRLTSWREFFADGHLFIFITALAVSLCVHFYATILALYICIIVVLLNLRKLFRRGSLSRLAAGTLIALLAALLPMAAALAEGYPLQRSLYWAMSVTRESAAEAQNALGGGAARLSLPEIARRFVNGTYRSLYGKIGGGLLLRVDILAGGLSLLLLAFLGVRGLGRKPEKEGLRRWTEALKGYLFAALSVFVLMIAYRPWLLGLPALIEDVRVCSALDLFVMLLYACVLDLVFALAGSVVRERYLKPVSALVCLGIYVLARGTGIFHGYLGYDLTRYPVAAELTKEITEHVPKGQYTIISTPDELYQVIETGFHEEWTDFLERSADEAYTIPTPYLFFFIEKHPIQYAQVNFASGPSWLASEKYAETYWKGCSQYPEILHGQVSEEAAGMEFTDVTKKSDKTATLHNRTILESRAYEWYSRFSSLYPHEGRVIYEDEDFLCYCVHQNEQSLFSLGVMDR